MTISLVQFEEIRLKMLAYSYRFQHEGRGPGCRACVRAAEGHAGLERPVCLTVDDLVAEISFLVQDTGGLCEPCFAHDRAKDPGCLCPCHTVNVVPSGSSK